MTLLPISSPAPAPRETLYSYLARLAATWRTDAPDLAYDMGAPFKLLLDQDETALETFADWTGLQPEALAEMLSWTGVRAGNVRMQFRGELYTSRALRNPVMRGCPICLQEDTAKADGPASIAMVMRGHWQMREAGICVEHAHPLVRLWDASAPRVRYDIGARLQEIEVDILSGALDRARRNPSAYDLWLDRRLEDGSDDTWLKAHSVFAITTLCRFMGEILLKNDAAKHDEHNDAVHAAGFDVIVHGKNAICAELDQIARRASGSLHEPSTVFGKLFSDLRRLYATEESFDFFRDILRDCILANWPIAVGEDVLGQIVQVRRLHSLRTAEMETGIGSKVLEQFLVEAGALSPDDDRPPNRKLFDAQGYADLLAEIPTLVGPIAMREAMGATRQELVALVDARVLVPRTQVDKVKNPWRISDGLALVAKLTVDAIPVAESDTRWETLLRSHRRRYIGISQLLQAICDQRLTAGQQTGVEGFHGIVVLKSEVDLITTPKSLGCADSFEALSSTVPAVKFGRAVGLRDGGAFQSMIKAGYVPAQQVMNPRSGRPQYRMSSADIAAFNERFVTLTTLSGETGQHRNTLRGIIAARRIRPFSPDGQNFGSVYRAMREFG